MMMTNFSLGTLPGSHLDRVIDRHARAERRLRTTLFVVLMLALTLPLLLV